MPHNVWQPRDYQGVEYFRMILGIGESLSVSYRQPYVYFLLEKNGNGQRGCALQPGTKTIFSLPGRPLPDIHQFAILHRMVHRFHEIEAPWYSEQLIHSIKETLATPLYELTFQD